MVALFLVAVCHNIAERDFNFSVLREESESGYQTGRVSAAVIGKVDHDILHFAMLLDILETVIEESKSARFIILFLDRIQIVGRFSVHRIIIET